MISNRNNWKSLFFRLGVKALSYSISLFSNSNSVDKSFILASLNFIKLKSIY